MYKLLIIIATFKNFSSVLKRLVRMNFKGLQMLKLPLVTYWQHKDMNIITQKDQVFLHVLTSILSCYFTFIMLPSLHYRQSIETECLLLSRDS